MPNFQSATNAMLGMAAAATALNPELRAEREAKTAETKAQKLEEAYGGAVEKAKKIIDDPNIPDTSPKRENANQTLGDYNKRMTEAASQALDANPTAERAKRLIELRGSEIRGESYVKGASEDARNERIMKGLLQEEMKREEALARGEDPDTGEPMYVSRDESKMTSSNQRAQKQVKAKASQRRNFKTYLAQQPTSLGGTVGDLSPDLQKKIASQYSRSDRRRMMDQMDREAKNGKQE